MKRLIHQACTLLGEKKDFVLVTISSQSGSTPRLVGTKMLIHRDGRINGTIGGGMVEALTMEVAGDCFTFRQSLRRTFDLSNNDVAGTDMICGGKLELFLDYIPATEANRTLFQTLQAAITSGRRMTMVCPLKEGGGGGQRFVLDHRGQSSRSDTPPTLLSAIKQLRSPAGDVLAATFIEHQGREYFLSSFAVAGHLFLVGGGHVSACTAEAAARLGFKITVLDDRAEFANKDRFPLADEVRVLPSFTDCFRNEAIDGDTYVVIVTRGHQHDLEVLDQALQTNAGYIGMIGSRRKRNAIYAKLMDRGIGEAQLERVHCPIGLAIEADTPEEIAVSIAGELIYQRATGRKPWHLV